MPVPPVPNPQHESQLLAGAHADSAAPPSPSTNLDSDITDELTDHLALASRDLQLAGHTGDEVQKLAHQKFGDIAALRRRLWWIQKGDEVMLRTAFAIVLVVLVLAVAALGIGGWQISQTMSELGDALATMNETQRALLASREKEERPLAIRGRLYVGDKSQPASYASVDVYSLPGGKNVETLVADEDGRFGTSSLEAGHYSLLAKLVSSDDDSDTPSHLLPDFYAIQSQPISVYPWSKDTPVELDVAMIKYGRVTLELTKPFPQVIDVKLPNSAGDRKVTAYPALALAIPVSKGIKTLPIRRLSDSQKFDWPVVGIKGAQESDHDLFDASKFNYGNYQAEQPLPIGKPIPFSRVQHRGAFRTGTYQVGAYMTFGYSIPDVPSDVSVAIHPTWQIIGESNLTTLPEQSRASFEVVDKRRTHLRITPPDDLEQMLRQAIAETEGDEKKLQELQQKAYAVKLEVVGQMDLFNPQEWSPPPAGPSGGYGSYGTTRGGYGGAR
jgi:hypothetical protein